MIRRNFLKTVSAALIAPSGLQGVPVVSQNKEILTADIVVIGGGLGGVASALAALRNGKTVILTEETDWLGGQLTQQGVPPDEHRWIEHTGATKTYRDFRNKIREYYKRNYPLKEHLKNDPYLNPGNASVSRFCLEPRVALAALHEMLASYIGSGKLTVLYRYKALKSSVNGDIVEDITVKNSATGDSKILKAPYFVDATELGDLLPLTGTEFVTGTESRKDTGELHAPQEADPHNVQAFTVCFAVDYLPGENHVIPKPADYGFWSGFVPRFKQPWPGKLLDLHYSNPRTLEKKELCFNPTDKCGSVFNLWSYRRIADKNNFEEGAYRSDISLVNWPQNDYFLGNLIGASEKDFQACVEGGKQLSLSLLYWLQTEARWPGLRLRKDILGSDDGLAKYPYVRESRRIKSLFTVTEQHVGRENRALVSTENKEKAAFFHDSVGIGYYPIDLHPSTGMNNYVDMDALRFQIPLGALLPVRMKNLLPVNKNIGTTHITNGCYRLHPVEWNIGEAVGELLSFSMDNRYTPRRVWEQKGILNEFQAVLRSRGIESEWPSDEELEKMQY
jgi:hypothetical protein